MQLCVPRSVVYQQFDGVAEKGTMSHFDVLRYRAFKLFRNLDVSSDDHFCC